MLAIKLDSKTEQRLDFFSRKMGKSMDELGLEAVQRLIEDMEDYVLAEQRLEKDDPTKRITLEQLKADLGLDD